MKKIILSGYGGQGIMLCGQVLAYAGMQDGKNVSWIPSYGPEMRGGAAYCNVIISEAPVGSPVVERADAVVAMNQPSYDKFEGYVAPGGIIIINTSLVNAVMNRDDITYYDLDCTGIALELGNLRVANMVAFGGLNKLTQCVTEESAAVALAYMLGEKKTSLIDINKGAMGRGGSAITVRRLGK